MDQHGRGSSFRHEATPARAGRIASSAADLSAGASHSLVRLMERARALGVSLEPFEAAPLVLHRDSTGRLHGQLACPALSGGHLRAQTRTWSVEELLGLNTRTPRTPCACCAHMEDPAQRYWVEAMDALLWDLEDGPWSLARLKRFLTEPQHTPHPLDAPPPASLGELTLGEWARLGLLRRSIAQVSARAASPFLGLDPAHNDALVSSARSLAQDWELRLRSTEHSLGVRSTLRRFAAGLLVGAPQEIDAHLPEADLVLTSPSALPLTPGVLLWRAWVRAVATHGSLTEARADVADLIGDDGLFAPAVSATFLATALSSWERQLEHLLDLDGAPSEAETAEPLPSPSPLESAWGEDGVPLAYLAMRLGPVEELMDGADDVFTSLALLALARYGALACEDLLVLTVPVLIAEGLTASRPRNVVLSAAPLFDPRDITSWGYALLAGDTEDLLRSALTLWEGNGSFADMLEMARALARR